MKTDLVRTSRAGDVFHYRWAARRCLRLVEPNSPLRCITIEGSRESEQAGEYAIDIAEYSKTEHEGEETAYYQLKHSTVRTDKNFTLSEFKSTLEQFAKRFLEAGPKSKRTKKKATVKFVLVTNRRISPALNKAVVSIREGKKHSSLGAFEETTNLNGKDLRDFCAILELVGGEGNYVDQKRELHGEMADYFVGPIERNEIDGLIALVSGRALPDPEDGEIKGEIFREHVLQRLGVTTVEELFPAQPKFESVLRPIRREQHEKLLSEILSSSTPIIIHAPGGVGKSVVARQLVESLSTGSWGLVYDCFGAGNYRNESQPRHRPREALVQIANELALAGLCRPLIARLNNSNTDFFRGFLDRVKQAISALRSADPDAQLLLLLDAADNAEMVAHGSNDCFVHSLLLESLPDGCHLAALCRTERIDLLQPTSSIRRFELSSFSLEETSLHLRSFCPSASDQDALEFHSRTNANPRVQANVLSVGGGDVSSILSNLGPAGTTVDEQIAAQLNLAVCGIKDKHPAIFASQIDAICLGLANLPPFIPLEILAKAAEVDVSAIRSFVYDLGRPLLLSDNAVQFRDEPTETWFRKKFAAHKEQFLALVKALEPFAVESTYVARSLPQLLQRAGELSLLVELALSDKMLPEDNPIDARDIRVYRLQFAFKAALNLERVADACRLAFRAGEEMAGDQRQMDLLAKNLDLIPSLQTEHRVQELAYRGMLRSSWNGSDTVFSAALLSSIDTFKGEARSYLRGAERWMRIHIEERDKIRDEHLQVESITKNDVVELAWTNFNLFGAKGAVEFILRWKSPTVVFQVCCMLIRRMVDASQFEEIDQFARHGAKNIYITIAVADELISIGRFPPKESIEHALVKLGKKGAKLEKGGEYGYQDITTPAVMSLCEAGAANGVLSTKVLAVLERYMEKRADRSVADDHSETSRHLFLRGAALHAVLCGEDEPSPASFITEKVKKEDAEYHDNIEKELKEVIGALLPLYYIRARLLVRDPEVDSVNFEEVRLRAKKALYSRHRTYDRIPYEMSIIWFDILVLKTTATPEELEHFASSVVARSDKKFYLKDRLSATRTAFRNHHLHSLAVILEQSCRKSIESYTDQGPEEQANDYIDLARSVLPHSTPDAAAYFSYAVEAVSKFGDEIVDRWDAVIASARRASGASEVATALVFRFVRCAEMVTTVAQGNGSKCNEMFQIAAKLHAPSAFSALSRWRDRAVGDFGDELSALATEAVKNGDISPSCGWGLTGFMSCNGSSDYACLCASHEPDPAKRELIVEMAIRDLQLVGASASRFRNLETVAAEFPAKRAKIAEIVSSILHADVVKSSERASALPHEDQARLRIEALMMDVDFSDPSSLKRAFGAMKSMEPPREFDKFWKITIRRIPPGKEIQLLDFLLNLENLSYSEISVIIGEVRRSWLEKAAVKRRWNCFLVGVGRRFAIELTNHHRLSFLQDYSGISDSDLENVKNGVADGLAESSDIIDAATFFGFVSCAANRLSPSEAVTLLDYSLGRFEEHIPKEFGDGEWAQWLQPPNETSDAVSGLIWSALGSPQSATRWEAAHCVRRLAEVGCEKEMSALMNRMRRNEVDAFGSREFPFYALHARLYLLIALARIALDHPEILVPFAHVFTVIALEGAPHILIQRNAADIAIRIESLAPGSYTSEVVTRLRNVGVSELSPRITKSGNVDDSPWHLRSEVDLTIERSLEYEFNWYWFDQVGAVFGVKNDQVEQLAKEIAVKDLGIVLSDDYKPDPRREQWNSDYYRDRGTSHSHGSYPRIDTYSFYYSYHSFLMVASKLLKSVPVVRHPEHDYNGDRWSEWVKRHSLTRIDGRWLSDRRDPTPIIRRSWVNALEHKDWRWDVQRDDFRDVLVNQSAAPGFLSVWGHWTDCVGDNIEDLIVRSALVSREAAWALAASIRTSSDFYPVTLPYFDSDDEDEDSVQNPPFDLVGWIKRIDESGNRLDQFDLHARGIRYPPNEIGDAYVSMLGLKADHERRIWSSPHSATPSVINEIWSDRLGGSPDVEYRSGERMSASTDLLKELCVSTGKDLIFCVEIDRRIHRDYRYRGSGEEIYTPNSLKIFLMTYDGILRDAQEGR